jgi:hypothetical protein
MVAMKYEHNILVLETEIRGYVGDLSVDCAKY